MSNTCRHCRFFSENPRLDDLWQCRRNAPIYVPNVDKHHTQWPIVRKNNWCGEHQERAA